MSNQSMTQDTPKVTPYLLFLTVFILYILTPLERHTYDALVYASAARTALDDPEMFFHPHHLLYNPLGHLVYRCLVLFGWEGGTLIPLQALNSLFGAACVALFYRWTARFTPRPAALVFSILLAVAHAFWLYSVEVEVYVVAVLFLVWAATLMDKDKARMSWKEGMKIGAIGGGAVLAHQTNVLFLPVLLVVLCHSASVPRRLRFQFAGGAALALMITVGIPYGIAILVLRLDSAYSVLWWLTVYAQTGDWGTLEAMNCVRAMAGVTNSIVAVEGRVLLGIASLGFLLVTLAAIWRARSLSPIRRSILVTWIIPYAIFFVWWEPRNIEFWIAILPPVLAGWAFAAGSLFIHHRKASVSAGLILCLVVATVNWHFGLAMRSHEYTADPLDAASRIGQYVEEGDVLILPNTFLAPWLTYYHSINVFCLDQKALAAELRDPEKIDDLVRNRLDATMEDAFRNGKRVFVAANLLTPPRPIVVRSMPMESTTELIDSFRACPTTCSYIAWYADGSPAIELYEMQSNQDASGN